MCQWRKEGISEWLQEWVNGLVWRVNGKSTSFCPLGRTVAFWNPGGEVVSLMHVCMCVCVCGRVWLASNKFGKKYTLPFLVLKCQFNLIYSWKKSFHIPNQENVCLGSVACFAVSWHGHLFKNFGLPLKWKKMKTIAACLHGTGFLLTLPSLIW